MTNKTLVISIYDSCYIYSIIEINNGKTKEIKIDKLDPNILFNILKILTGYYSWNIEEYSNEYPKEYNKAVDLYNAYENIIICDNGEVIYVSNDYN